MKFLWDNGSFVETAFHQLDGRAQGLVDQFGPPDQVVYLLSVCPWCSGPQYIVGEVGAEGERFVCVHCGATYQDPVEEQECDDASPC